MKKVCNLLTLGIVLMLIATGCNKNEEEILIDSDPLYGYWKKTTGNEYLRFMTEQEDVRDGDYLFGYEWNEDDDVYESDIQKQYHGNGWFKYKMTTKSKSDTILHELHFMDNQGATIPKTYTIVSTSSQSLIYKDNLSTYSFIKVNR